MGLPLGSQLLLSQGVERPWWIQWSGHSPTSSPLDQAFRPPIACDPAPEQSLSTPFPRIAVAGADRAVPVFGWSSARGSEAPSLGSPAFGEVDVVSSEIFSSFFTMWALNHLLKVTEFPYCGVGVQRNGMRITHSEGEHLVVLSDEEAAVLVEASALLVLASQSFSGAALPPGMAVVLGQLFDGLKGAPAVSSSPQGS